ncbi:MAG: ANTAR domain-containing protein [Mycobacteriaceae bacterium]|nr:ANTAR domain-containing protein [Mycobacteriaceae bacterium]
MPPEHEYDALLRALLVAFRRDLFRDPIDIDRVLEGVTSTAVNFIDGVDHADVLIVQEGGFESRAPTAPLAVELDNLQYGLQEGPCLQAAVTESVVRSPDLREESRWPRFAPAAVRRGVCSVLSFQLSTDGGGSGALNLLGAQPRAFPKEAEALGAVLAAHAAAAVSAIDQHRNFRSALASRDEIGQAKGILMERFNISADSAFEVLKRLSQNTNTPLRDVATRLIATRSTPGGPTRL